MESRLVLTLLMLTAMVFSSNAQQTYECPVGFDNFLDKCYQYSSVTRNFADSETECNALHADGHLASIATQEVQDFIKTTYYDPKDTFFWIGLTDQVTEGVWVWTDGKPYVFTNWGIFAGNQLPESNTNYNCASISDITETKGDWSDAVCNGFAHHLCEIPATMVTTTAAPTTMAPTTEAPTTAAAPTPNPTVDCYGEWIRHGDQCFRITKGLKTWTKAQFFCVTILNGATLAKIDSQEVQDFLFDTYLKPRRHGMWIGLNSANSVGTWTWSKDSTSPAYTNWATINGSLQPENTSNKRCVATDNRQGQMGKWNDFKCTMKAWSICQRPAS